MKLSPSRAISCYKHNFRRRAERANETIEEANARKSKRNEADRLRRARFHNVEEHSCESMTEVIDIKEEMESDSEKNYILVVDNPCSLKAIDSVKQHVNKGPVFSLECLHEDDEQHLLPKRDANNSDNRDITENSIKLEKCDDKDPKEIKCSAVDSHGDVDAGTELVMNCDDDSEDSKSSHSSSVNVLEVIDMDEVPELIISSGEDDSQEPASATTNNTANTSMDTADASGLMGDSIELSALKEPTSATTNNTANTNNKAMDAPDVSGLMGDFHKQSALKIPNLNPVSNDSSNVPQISSFRPSPSVAPGHTFEGKCLFKIKVHHPQNLKKAEGLKYCELQNKLFISKDHPFKILVSANYVPIGSVIKATAVYSLAEHSHTAVRRCPLHEQQDREIGNFAYKHLIQSLSKSAKYNESEDGVLSVSVPYEEPQVGESCTSYIFELTDYTSCHNGINKRPIKLIFTLEKDGIALGRQTMEVRICAAPLRDYKLEKMKLQRTCNYLFKDCSPKKDPVQPKETYPNYYTITVKDPELYQFLEQMKVLYESSAAAVEWLSNKNS